MPKIIAVNNIKAKCGNLSFRECSVVFRNKATFQLDTEKLYVSNLVNPSFMKHKDNIICYCDGMMKVERRLAEREPEVQEEEKEDVSCEDVFAHYNIVDREELEESIDELYKKEKITWVRRFSKDQNLVEAINLDYECDEQYCRERIQQEYPGFFMIDETTCFYKSKFPSQKVMGLEKRLTTQVNGARAKYGTYIRIVELEAHDHVNYDDQEAIAIFNYLHKFDIVGLVPVVEKDLYGEQLELVSNRS